MRINLNKKYLFIFFNAFLGFGLVIYYLWFRFIRERLPREIPFMLTPLSCICLCFLCIVYIYFVYRMFKPLTIQSFSIMFLYPKLKLLYKPFYFFDKILKKNKKVSAVIFKIFFSILIKFKLYKTTNNKYFYLICNFIPKFIIIIAFMFDVFYLHYLQIFYNVIFLGLVPLLYTYSLYTMTQYLELLLNYLDKNFHVKILSTEKEEEEYEQKYNKACFFLPLDRLDYNDNEVLNSKYFIEWQCENLIFEYQLYKYTCIETWFARDMYVKKHKINHPKLWVYEPESDEISKALSTKFKDLMPQAYYFRAFIETCNKLIKPNYIKYDRYILIGYLICWMYILVVSFHTLNILELLDALKAISSNISEPFSDTTLSYIFLILFKNKKLISPEQQKLNTKNKEKQKEFHNNDTKDTGEII